MNSSFTKFKIKFMDEIIFVKVLIISVFNILMKRLFKLSSEECEYHFVTVTEARLKGDSLVKTSAFIGQKTSIEEPFTNLTLSLPVPYWAGANTDPPSNRNISKMVKLNITFTKTFLQEY